jgi:hypothetical protein
MENRLRKKIKRMKKTLSIFFSFLLLVLQPVMAQQDCKDIDLKKVPGKWVWDKSGGGTNPAPDNQWAICEPIRKELLRIFPKQVDGIIAFNSIAFGDHKLKTMPVAGSPNAYTSYLMVKDYECLMDPNAKVKTAVVTACWVYVDVNANIETPNGILPGGSDVEYTGYPSILHLTDLWIERDANGNRILYTSTEKGQAFRQGFLFSANPNLPFRKLSRKELYNCYNQYHAKRLAEKISAAEKTVAKEQNDYNNLSAAEKKRQESRLIAIANAKKTLSEYLAEKEKLTNWYASAMRQNNLNDTAYARSIVSWQVEPDKLDAVPGEGFPVWIPDIRFYDKSKPADQPQYIFFYYRRQDVNVPKKKFMDEFCTRFNLDVLARMVGEAPKKPGGVNTILSSTTDVKPTTKAQQNDNDVQRYSFENTGEGAFPEGWQGMKNVTIQTSKGAKWLAMTKPGYWFPRQYDKEIKDGFSLSFDLEWPEKISYYSSLFTLTFGEVKYDNVAERYAIDDNMRNYWCLFGNHAGEFNRVGLWFDPHWNNGGSLDLYVYNWRETVLMSKKIAIPDFYKEKNKHRLTVQRKGNGLLVIDNGKTIADIPDVFVSTVRYNLYTFSKYKDNDQGEEHDIFYLNHINVRY